MDRLTAMRVFVTVVDAQGFSAASRILRMPLPTVSRKVAELEAHLGAQLLVRSTRKVTVTDSGQRYYEDVRHILDNIRDAERQVSGEYHQPKGHLAITAPTLFGRLNVLPIVNRFMHTYGDIDIGLFLSNHVADLLEEHIHLGVRIGTPPDSSMIAIQVGTVRQVVCAAPDYLARNNSPRSPKDLAGHRVILFSKGGPPAQWEFSTPDKKTLFAPHHALLTTNSVEAVVDSTICGEGLGQLYSYQAASHVADGTLQIVLSQFEVEPIPVNLVYPQSSFTPQKVRAFIDFSKPLLRDRLALIDRQCKATGQGPAGPDRIESSYRANTTASD